MLGPITSSAVLQECCQNQSNDLKKELKPFIQVSEHIACHLYAIFPYRDAWQLPIHTLPLPTVGLGPEWQGLCYERVCSQAECVGSGIKQMFEVHLPLSLSLSNNTIYILIDVPMGFGWTQLCRHPYPGNHFRVPCCEKWCQAP